ncbi:hypothetical protein ACFXHA_02040 [Nocardia sp. NPDC059240]|uniref:hypothetical protein n=1 Tax=Nocardia sp. NPDC059240 TaxID=3346786 RepID=UPI0036D040BD
MTRPDGQFQQALRRSRLSQPIPSILTNRATPVEVLDEPALTAMTEAWFVEYEHKIAFYAARGFDIAWTLDWAKKYWWSWQARDMSYNHELYTDDAIAIPGNGAFIQCTAVDRYHFNADHLMYEGETLYDLIDAVQLAGMLPGPTSRAFKWLMRGAALATRYVGPAR